MANKKFTIEIYTDGACRGNGKANNIGAFGIILKYGDKEKEISKAFLNTTNNKMELGSVIVALRQLKAPCKVTLYTDSKYVVDAINQKWINSWVRNNWTRGKNKEPVKNQEYWQELINLLKVHEVTFKWVKGHDTNVYNNRCDKLANIAMDNKSFNLVINEVDKSNKEVDEILGLLE